MMAPPKTLAAAAVRPRRRLRTMGFICRRMITVPHSLFSGAELVLGQSVCVRRVGADHGGEPNDLLAGEKPCSDFVTDDNPCSPLVTLRGTLSLVNGMRPRS